MEMDEDEMSEAASEKVSTLIQYCPCCSAIHLTEEEGGDLSTALEKRYICLVMLACMGAFFVVLSIFTILTEPGITQHTLAYFMMTYGLFSLVLFFIAWRLFVIDVRQHGLYLVAMRNRNLATIEALASSTRRQNTRRVPTANRRHELDNPGFEPDLESDDEGCRRPADTATNQLPTYNGYIAAGANVANPCSGLHRPNKPHHLKISIDS